MTEKTQDYPWLKHYPDNVRWDAEIAEKPLYAILDEAERQFADRPCLDFMGRKYTYREVARQSRRLAAGLRKLGVRRQVKVGLCLPNCPQFVIAYFAILRAGGTVVNFNPLYSARELKHQIQNSGAEVMITLALNAIYPKVAEQLRHGMLKHIVVSQLSEALPLPKRLVFPLLKKGEIAEFPEDNRHHKYADLMLGEEDAPRETVHPREDIAVLQYTGGTTGTPKGAMLTHANLYANAAQCALWFPEAKPGKERVLGVLPLFHVFAMTAVMNLGILKGAEIILHPRFDMKSVMEDIHHKKPTLLPGVPTMFNALANYKNLKKYDLSSLNMCISGGAPLPLDTKRRFEELTGCVLVEGYGLSESSPVVSANPLRGVNKPGSIGMPFPRTVLEVISLADGRTPMPVGEKGEICISGPQVMHGYWQQMDDTGGCLKNGRLHTGDIGYMDGEGYFFVVDRLKEMIISGGYNVYPRNVEEALFLHPEVAEAAVIGIPHEFRGEVPKAFVARTEGSVLTETDLKAFLKDQLPPYAVPAYIEFRAELPKTLIGKVDKKALKEK